MRIKNKHVFVSGVAAFLLSGAVQAVPSACESRVNNTFDKIQECMTIEHLVGHLQAFQQQADENSDLPGTRFTGTAGYNASRDYIVNKMKQAGYKVRLQKVPLDIAYVTLPREFTLQSPAAKTYQDNVDYTPFVNSGAGDITGSVQTPGGDIQGCNASDFAGFTPDNIALLQRGTCTSNVKVANAITAGAKGVIIYNDTPGLLFVGLSSPVPTGKTPVVFVTPEVAAELKAAMQTGDLPVVHINFNTVRKTGYTDNIIAESAGGDPDHVVMVGAHLDSSAGNSGMNDNGSASAAILETALLMQNVKPVNKVRFAWWTSEELGLLGSNYYVSQLSDDAKKKIKVYLNYEILGAPNGGRLIMDAVDGVTPPGSEKITKLYQDYFNSVGLKSYAFDPRMGNAAQRSDMYAFMQAGIPCGYLVTGAELPWNPLLDAIFTDLSKRTIGVATHPCYHKFCDTLTWKNGELSDPNFDFDLYLQMSKAAAYAIYTYSMGAE